MKKQKRNEFFLLFQAFDSPPGVKSSGRGAIYTQNAQLRKEKESCLTARIVLRNRERGWLGMTVVVFRPVVRFRDLRVFLRMRDGREVPLGPQECTCVLLTSDLFPEGDKAAISVYLTRRGIATANRRGAGGWLLICTETEPSGRGNVQVHARRMEIYSKITV